MGWLAKLVRSILGPRPGPMPPPPPDPIRGDRTAFEALAILNGLRPLGRPLAWDDRLADAALAHAADMAGRGRLDHDGSDGSTFVDRAGRAGFPAWKALGECVAWNQRDAEAAVRSWYSSPGHRGILMDPVAGLVGVAVAYSDAPGGTPYWCAVTARP